MKSPLTELELEALMDQVVSEVANPPGIPGLSERLLQRTFAMTSPAPLPANVLAFSSLERSAANPPSTFAYATLLHLAALLLIVLGFQAHKLLAPKPVQMIALKAPPAPPLTAAPRAQTMGGGGGSPDHAPVTHGNPPKFAPEQIVPPKAPVIDAKLRVDPTVDVQQNLKMAPSDTVQLGVSNSPLVGMSLGNERGAGLGGGNGSGIGPGAGGNMGGGLRRIGGGVAAPVVLFAPEPEFSEEARKAKVAGNVLIYLQVDIDGRPSHVRVLRGIGMGLDDKAIEAVRQYRFKPAMENGRPVPVEMNVEVGFQIF